LHYLINGEKQTKAFDVTADIGQSTYTSGKNIYTSKGREIFKNGQKFMYCAVYDTRPFRNKINAILISGEDVYAVGSSWVYFGRYSGHEWKNGLIKQMYPTSSTCNSIFISDDDIYVGGKMHKVVNGKLAMVPIIWKNGDLFRSFYEEKYECPNDKDSGVISVFIK
jgi:hypothetical protein